eukprot:CFRG2255T1
MPVPIRTMDVETIMSDSTPAVPFTLRNSPSGAGALTAALDGVNSLAQRRSHEHPHVLAQAPETGETDDFIDDGGHDEADISRDIILASQQTTSRSFNVDENLDRPNYTHYTITAEDEESWVGVEQSALSFLSGLRNRRVNDEQSLQVNQMQQMNIQDIESASVASGFNDSTMMMTVANDPNYDSVAHATAMRDALGLQSENSVCINQEVVVGERLTPARLNRRTRQRSHNGAGAGRVPVVTLSHLSMMNDEEE